MNVNEIKAELSVRMIELERAIDIGMPYRELKKIYNEIKELQLKVATSEADQNEKTPLKNNVVIE